MKTTTSNYNAFNEFANSHKVQLSIDVQNLLEEDTNEKAEVADSLEASILQWTKLPVLKSENASLKQPAQTTAKRLRLASQETTVQIAAVQLLPTTEQFSPSATGLRRVITKYRGLVYTQSLPAAPQADFNGLLGHLRAIVLDRRQEQKARQHWFGTRFASRDALQIDGFAKNLLDNARMRWS